MKETKPQHEYGCVMLMVNQSITEKFHPLIKKEDIYEDSNDSSYGLENEPHVTILYGLHTEVTPQEITDLVRDVEVGEFIEISGISLFENQHYDVLKWDVKKSPFLVEMRNKLIKLPHTTSYPKFNPHITISYVKKGMGKKYMRQTLTDLKFKVKVEELIYSQTDGSKINI